MLHAQRAQVIALLIASRGRKYLRAGLLCQLNGRKPHPATRGVDQNSLALRQPAQVMKAMIRGQERVRQLAACSGDRSSMIRQMSAAGVVTKEAKLSHARPITRSPGRYSVMFSPAGVIRP